MSDLLIFNNLRSPESRINNAGDTYVQPPDKGPLVLQVNGVLNEEQLLLNLQAGTYITLSDDGNGTVTITGTGGGGGGGGGGVTLSDANPSPVAQDADPGTSSQASRADHIHAGAVFRSQVILHSSDLIGLALDGSVAAQVVPAAGNGIDGIVPIAVTWQYQPGSSPYAGNCLLNLFPGGDPSAKWMTGLSQDQLGLTALNTHFNVGVVAPFSGSPDLLSGAPLVAGISGTTALTGGDGNLVITVIYMFQSVPATGPS